MKIAIIIPTYNEAANLERLLPLLLDLPLDLRVLVVDDNSQDGTAEVAEKYSKRFFFRVAVLRRSGKLGLRSAYIEGIRMLLNSSVDAIVQMDADLSHHPSALVKMAEKLAESDVVLGSRYISGGSVDRNWPPYRKLLSAFGNFYARTILQLPVRDVTTGFRMWRAEALRQMPLDRIQSNGYVFLAEMLYMAHCLQFRIAETPIYFADRQFGSSKMSFAIQVEAAARIWMVRFSYRDLKKDGRIARVGAAA